MPFLGKANLAIAVVGEWASAHRTVVLLLAVALTVVGQQAGLITPLDWWGTGEEIR